MNFILSEAGIHTFRAGDIEKIWRRKTGTSDDILISISGRYSKKINGVMKFYPTVYIRICPCFFDQKERTPIEILIHYEKDTITPLHSEVRKPSKKVVFISEKNLEKIFKAFLAVDAAYEGQGGITYKKMYGNYPAIAQKIKEKLFE